jgi:uroporphyrinogen-III synthase
MTQSKPLLNKTILVTRPNGREANLCQLIETAGGRVIHYPAITIRKLPEQKIKKLHALYAQLEQFSMAIFISPTAVEQSHIYFPSFPENISIVSMGSKTTKALEKLNIPVTIESPKHNTETLLETEAFASEKIKHHKILVFRGTGGRSLLGDSLLERGASMQYVETYSRELPTSKPLTPQQLSSLDVITISSNEGLTNLITLMGGAELLTDIPLIVPSIRANKLARQYDFSRIIIAKDATDTSTLLALNEVYLKK